MFPTEIVGMILARLSSSAELESETDGWDARNAELARMALVGRQYQASAYTLLYGHMRICWRSSRCVALLRSFAANPALHALVRSLDVYRLTEMRYLGEWLHSDEGFRQMATARTEMLASDPDDALGGGSFARVATRGVEHVRRVLTERGDHLWLNGVDSYVEGSNLLWHWVGAHLVRPFCCTCEGSADPNERRTSTRSRSRTLRIPCPKTRNSRRSSRASLASLSPVRSRPGCSPTSRPSRRSCSAATRSKTGPRPS